MGSKAYITENVLKIKEILGKLPKKWMKMEEVMTPEPNASNTEEPAKHSLWDVLLRIILFIDKTHTKSKSNKTLEPVCMTLGIFNRP